MNNQKFSLLPFSSSPSVQNLKLTGTLERYANTLTIQYTLFDPHSVLQMPAVSSGSPLRKHKLWEETCFEFFLAHPHQDAYWEFNLSLTEDWNVYRFETYRSGMKEELCFTSLPIVVKLKHDGLSLALTLNLDKIFVPNTRLEIAISAVIKPPQEPPTYWALTHLGLEADFHRRDSFILQV